MELPLSAPQLSAAAACLAVLLLPLILLFVRSGPGKSAKPVASYSELRTRTVAVNGDLVQTLVPDWYAGRSLYDRQPKEQALGPYGYQSLLVNKRHIRLVSYFWPAAALRAVVLLVHGHGASLLHEYLHMEKPGTAAVYAGSLVEKLNDAGFSVCGIDLEGLGFSEGIRSFVNEYTDYVEDVLLLERSLESVRGFGGHLPLFITGVSLGGCIACDVCFRLQHKVKGAILLAPMLSLERVSRSGLNPYLRPIAGLLSYLFPRLAIVKTDKNVLNAYVQRFFDEDPQVWHGHTRARNANEYLLATEALCANMHKFTFSFMVVHGEADTLTDPAGSKRLYAESEASDKEIHIIKGRWHVLLKEDGNLELMDKVVTWIDARV